MKRINILIIVIISILLANRSFSQSPFSINIGYNNIYFVEKDFSPKYYVNWLNYNINACAVVPDISVNKRMSNGYAVMPGLFINKRVEIETGIENNSFNYTTSDSAHYRVNYTTIPLRIYYYFVCHPKLLIGVNSGIQNIFYKDICYDTPNINSYNDETIHNYYNISILMGYCVRYTIYKHFSLYLSQGFEALEIFSEQKYVPNTGKYFNYTGVDIETQIGVSIKY